MGRCACRLLGQIDLTLLEPHEELLGADVHELDLVGALEHRVGDGLPHLHAGDLRDHVVEALHVLHVHRGEHVDACVEQVHHVLPALAVARALHVGVGQLVHQDEAGPPHEGRLEIELLEHAAAVLDFASRQHLQTFHESRGLGALVRLHDAHHHVDALTRELPRNLQHAVGLAHPGSEAEKHLQRALRAALFFCLRAAKQCVGVGALGLGHGRPVSDYRAVAPRRGLLAIKKV